MFILLIRQTTTKTRMRVRKKNVKKVPATSNCRLALAKLEYELKQQQRQWVNGKKVKNWIHSVVARNFFSTLFNIHNNGEEFFVYCCFSRNLIYSAAIFSLYFPHKFLYIFFWFFYVLLCILLTSSFSSPTFFRVYFDV